MIWREPCARERVITAELAIAVSGGHPSPGGEASVDGCASCHRAAGHGTALVTLTSQRGDYQLCRHCLGCDGEARPPRPTTAIPPPRRARAGARHALALATQRHIHAEER